ncbi:RES family NAD+ phosphorylase [Flavobacterium branchiarum]|uniref:RES family NAD+ phosphorylase n=1 Tax=Flavobacterium branchiarum TaxID=1114870 RepID=A0ABV5FMP4_9FLAO|nr:RES family NAD+ phosphorylase [Flavobacterium branchiarum]MDN3674344.1 RES family NAD+ phosphorylase [Flavobacterium branchiarum]
MDDNRKEEFLICSNCFKDEGLKIDAKQIGIENDEPCKKCKSEEGAKLTKDLTRDLCYRFFVRGTIEKCEYGGFPLIEMNEQHYNRSDIDVSPWLIDDVKVIEKAGEIGLFYYGPRFWMFGEIEPLKSLQNKEERDEIIETILNKYPVKYLNPDKYFYRLRKDPKVPHNFSEYDTPPEQFIGDGRFDIPNFPILYGSQDLEICIHECRTTVEDNIFVGKLKPKQNLKLLDLTEHIEEENVTEFESLDMAIHFLFLAGKHSYEICRNIAKQAHKKGFDGIIYPSYFSYLRTGTIPFDTVYGISIRRIPQYRNYVASQIIPNLALFGRPIEENKVEVECVNKVLINKVIYETSFGPAYHKAFSEEENINV